MTIASHCFLFPQGIVKVGAVDADQHKSLGGQYSVRGFPTIKIFGANKNKPDDYQGTSSSFSINKKSAFLIGSGSPSLFQSHFLPFRA